MIDIYRWLFAALAIFLSVRDVIYQDFKYRELIFPLCACVFLLSIRVVTS